MPKKPKDTSWDLTAGVRNTGLNNLTQALGLRANEIVERLNNDQAFAQVAGNALLRVYNGSERVAKSTSMDDVKRLMGGRCFLADEVQEYLNLQHREVRDIPNLTGAQLKKLLAYLQATCQICGDRPAAETHILFPQPSTIGGASFSMTWVLANALSRWGIAIQNCDRASGRNFQDRFLNRVRRPQWFLMYWGPVQDSGVPDTADVDRLTEIGYSMPDLAIYALALGYLKQRGERIECKRERSDRTSAMLLDGVRACRTVDAGLNCYFSDHGSRYRPSLIKSVPLG